VSSAAWTSRLPGENKNWSQRLLKGKQHGQKSSRRYDRKKEGKELEIGKNQLHRNTKLSIITMHRHFSGMQ
jgi:hypothetical protein